MGAERDFLAARLADVQQAAASLDEQIRTLNVKRLMAEGAIRELSEALGAWPADAPPPETA